jgi:hypothetical protein
MTNLKKFFINFFLVILSLFVAIVAIEFFLKYFKPQDLSGSWRLRDETGLNLNKNSGESKHSFNKNSLKVKYSFGKYHNRKYPNLFGNEKKKILILGDSFTFGWLLNDEDTFIYLLQKKFKDKTFINAAAGAWGTTDHLRYIENYCKKINPKEVWIFLNNEDIPRSIRSNLYKLDNEGKLIKLIPQISFQQKIKFFLNSSLIYQWLIEHSNFIQLIRNNFIKISDHNITYDKIKNNQSHSDYNLFAKKLFLEINNQTKLCNANLKIFYIGWPLWNENYETLDFIKLAEKENFFIKNSIVYFNLGSTIYMNNINNNVDYYKFEEGHPNKFGNKNIFFAIQSFLK